MPLSGANGAVGQSIANATTMALLDTNAQNLRITTYDTSTSGAAVAAGRAIADGNKLILGPLLSDDIPAVVATARAARVPVISYSNDEGRAARDMFIMGNLPGSSIARTVALCPRARRHPLRRAGAGRRIRPARLGGADRGGARPGRHAGRDGDLRSQRRLGRAARRSGCGRRVATRPC